MVQLRIQEPVQAQLQIQDPVQVRFQFQSPIPMVDDYNLLRNKPTIEGIEIIGEQTFEDWGLIALTSAEIDQILV